MDQTSPAALAEWQNGLAERGILEAAVAMGWQPYGDSRGDFWRYPVLNLDGSQHITPAPENRPTFRLKNRVKGLKPKALWEPGSNDKWDEKTNGPRRPKYYFKPGLEAAIARHGGDVYGVSGEPDLLVMLSAGAENVICWFGEGSVPKTLAADLEALGANRFIIFPDLDKQGRAGAEKIAAYLAGSEVSLEAWQLPAELGDKGDLNKLWIACDFNPDLFWEQLMLCPPIEIDLAPAQPELPTPAAKKEPTDESDEVLWTAEVQAEYFRNMVEAVIADTRAEFRGNDEWSKNFACTLAHHEHDEDLPGAGFNRANGEYKCFKCNSALKIKEYLTERGMDPADYYPEVVKAAIEKGRAEAADRAKAKAGKKGFSPHLVSWLNAAGHVIDEIDGKIDEVSYEPLPLPFADMQKLGGFAKAITPGKVVAVSGLTGGGKTILIETITDYWRKLGYHGALWGPEWTPEEFIYRAVQRNGGPTFNDFMNNKLWLAEGLRGIPEGKRSGRVFDQKTKTYAKHVIERINNWPGTAVILDQMSASPEAVCSAFVDVSAGMAASKRRLAWAVFDYAQLVDTGKADDAKYIAQRSFVLFKQFCVEHKVVGIIVSQVDKASAKGALSNDAALNVESLLGVRPFVINLNLTINRDTLPSGKLANTGAIHVSKNSLGENGLVPLYLDPKLMKWTKRPDGEAA